MNEKLKNKLIKNKNLQKTLKTRKFMFNLLKSDWIFNVPIDKRNHLNRIYNSPYCLYCYKNGLQIEENLQHIIYDCPNAINFDNILNQQIKLHFYNILNINLTDNYLWIGQINQYHFPFDEFTSLMGSHGLIPKNLFNFINSISDKPKQTKLFLFSILIKEIAYSNYRKYHSILK